MRSYRVLLVLLVILISTTMGCDDPREMVLTEKDNNTTLNADVGQTFKIELKANATTGYAWHNLTTDANISQISDSEYKVSPACHPNMEGCGGTTTFTFEITAPGISTVKLIYQQEWDPKPTDDIFELTVVTGEETARAAD